jgi:hypothetical protein
MLVCLLAQSVCYTRGIHVLQSFRLSVDSVRHAHARARFTSREKNTRARRESCASTHRPRSVKNKHPTVTLTAHVSSVEHMRCVTTPLYRPCMKLNYAETHLRWYFSSVVSRLISVVYTRLISVVSLLWTWQDGLRWKACAALFMH